MRGSAYFFVLDPHSFHCDPPLSFAQKPTVPWRFGHEKVPQDSESDCELRGFVNRISLIEGKKNSHNAFKEEYISPPMLPVIICVPCPFGGGGEYGRMHFEPIGTPFRNPSTPTSSAPTIGTPDSV